MSNLFNELLAAMKESFDTCCAPNSWEDTVYELATKHNCTDKQADELSDIATQVANFFAEDMLKRQA